MHVVVEMLIQFWLRWIKDVRIWYSGHRPMLWLLLLMLWLFGCVVVVGVFILHFSCKIRWNFWKDPFFSGNFAEFAVNFRMELSQVGATLGVLEWSWDRSWQVLSYCGSFKCMFFHRKPIRWQICLLTMHYLFLIFLSLMGDCPVRLLSAIKDGVFSILVWLWKSFFVQ